MSLGLKQITEEQLRRALCLQLHINFFDLDTIVPDASLRALINRSPKLGFSFPWRASETR